MSTILDRLSSRRDIMTRSTPIPSRINIIPTRRTATITPRPTVSMRARPTISMTARPTSTGALLQTILPVAGAAGQMPARGVAGASGAGGLPGGGLTGGLSTSLGGITGDIGATFGGIVDQAKGFIPTAIKIIAAIVVIKIVLWLVRGRRR